MTEASERAAVVAEALSWQGTRYLPRGQRKIVRNDSGGIADPGGVDCASLLMCVFTNASAVSGLVLPDYPPDWHWNRAAERYLGAVLEHASEIPESQAQPGDIVLYRYGRTFSHGAIIVTPGWPAIVHALSSSGFVNQDVGTGGAWGGLPRRFFTLWGAS